MEIIKKVTALLKEHFLCDNCLGRQFAMLGHGLTNKERGRALKLVCVLEGSRMEKEKKGKGKQILLSTAINGFNEIAFQTLETLGFEAEKKVEECYLCEGIFNRTDEIAECAIEKLSQYEYDSFLVGIKAEVETEDREDELRSRFGIRWGESIRNELSREIGKRISKKTKKQVDMRRPDILVVLNPFKKNVVLEVNSLFIGSRYRKLARGISQSRWLCSECKGKGCQKCNLTGKMHPDSVEELIAGPLLEITNGECVKLHASGREDLDVRMLGPGRPFIVEVKKPRRRMINLTHLRKTINQRAEKKVEVGSLKYYSKEAVRKLKNGEKAVKSYRAVVEVEKEIGEEDIRRVEELKNVVISQVTPLRVSHRRAMKTRKKYLYGIELKKLKPNLVEMVMKCQGGLYIKELINGDEGRTKPSVSEVLNVSAKCLELDVIDIYMEGF